MKSAKRCRIIPVTPKTRIIISPACMWPWLLPATSNAITATVNTIAPTNPVPAWFPNCLTPDQAVKKTMAVAANIPQMTVLGIAGPGDPLANPERTFETFRRLSEEAPDIKLCVSTNGLALPDAVEELIQT